MNKKLLSIIGSLNLLCGFLYGMEQRDSLSVNRLEAFINKDSIIKQHTFNEYKENIVFLVSDYRQAAKKIYLELLNAIPAYNEKLSQEIIKEDALKKSKQLQEQLLKIDKENLSKLKEQPITNSQMNQKNKQKKQVEKNQKITQLNEKLKKNTNSLSLIDNTIMATKITQEEIEGDISNLKSRADIFYTGLEIVKKIIKSFKNDYSIIEFNKDCKNDPFMHMRLEHMKTTKKLTNAINELNEI